MWWWFHFPPTKLPPNNLQPSLCLTWINNKKRWKNFFTIQIFEFHGDKKIAEEWNAELRDEMMKGMKKKIEDYFGSRKCCESCWGWGFDEGKGWKVECQNTKKGEKFSARDGAAGDFPSYFLSLEAFHRSKMNWSHSENLFESIRKTFNLQFSTNFHLFFTFLFKDLRTYIHDKF